mgnify:CR=1 FL=1
MIRKGEESAEKDPIKPYEELFDDLLIYASNKFKNDFKYIK